MFQQTTQLQMKSCSISCHLFATFLRTNHSVRPLLKKNATFFLQTLFKQLWQTQEEEKVEYPSNLITLCNVFLNFSVLEVELIKTSETFGDILKCIMSAVPKMVDPNSTRLTAHFVLLGLILFRHRFKLNSPQLTVIQNDFLLHSISFLKQVHLSVTTDESNLLIHWNDISELWFLSVQNLIACGKTIEAVKKLILDSSWPKEVKVWIKMCNESSNNSFQDLQSALLPLANLE